jgi:hypothetical protein
VMLVAVLVVARHTGHQTVAVVAGPEGAPTPHTAATDTVLPRVLPGQAAVITGIIVNQYGVSQSPPSSGTVAAGTVYA